jgi:hypothetical protein
MNSRPGLRELIQKLVGLGLELDSCNWLINFKVRLDGMNDETTILRLSVKISFFRCERLVA